MALEPVTRLWPTIIVALVLTLYRKFIDTFLASTAAFYARQQINDAKPAWLTPALKTSKNPNAISDFDSTLSNTSSSDLSAIYAFFASLNIKLLKSQRHELAAYHKASQDFSVKKEKFLESVFKVTSVSAIAVYGFYVVNIEHDLFLHHRNQWPPYPAPEPYRQKTDALLVWYYILSMGYHMQRTLAQFHNPTRKDFVALCIHHWSTLTCLLFSYLAAFLRTGSLVMFIHENSDIFLESAKISGYVNWDFGKELFFGLFVISWVAMRLWAFSYKVLYEIVRFGSKQLWIGNSPLFYNWTCVVLLFVLEGLHIYWSFMIVRMLGRKLSGKKLKDIRSDNESAGEEETEVEKESDKEK